MVTQNFVEVSFFLIVVWTLSYIYQKNTSMPVTWNRILATKNWESNDIVEVRNKDNPGVTMCTLSKSQRSWHTLEHATPIRYLLPSIYKTTKFDELL